MIPLEATSIYTPMEALSEANGASHRTQKEPAPPKRPPVMRATAENLEKEDSR